MLENIENAITLQPMDRLGRHFSGRNPSGSRRVCHDADAMATFCTPVIW